MRNKYAGTCYRCGLRVEAGEGHFERKKRGTVGWIIQHAECAIKYRGTDYRFNPNKKEQSYATKITDHHKV